MFFLYLCTNKWCRISIEKRLCQPISPMENILFIRRWSTDTFLASVLVGLFASLILHGIAETRIIMGGGRLGALLSADYAPLCVGRYVSSLALLYPMVRYSFLCSERYQGYSGNINSNRASDQPWSCGFVYCLFRCFAFLPSVFLPVLPHHGMPCLLRHGCNPTNTKAKHHLKYNYRCGISS